MRRLLALAAACGGLLSGGIVGVAPVAHGPALVTSRTNAGWTSGNWSGYAGSVGSPATSITGEWQVPTITKTKGNSYSSAWIGIDGFTNTSLIQTGTEEDWAGGHAVYKAWWEILPANETVISSIVVHPGDIFTAQITKGSGANWTIVIDDTTSGKSFSITKSYSGPGASVEWILEAPEVNGSIATLAHYGNTYFINCWFDGGNAVFSAANRGIMVQGGKHVSTPSKPDAAKDGFEVAYGAKTPPPPL
jgi:hypothetical protein